MSEIPAANEIEELQERSHESRNRKIGLLISIIAIFLAICGALGRDAENLVIVSRVEASNTWAYFQAKKLRSYQSDTTRDLARLFGAASSAAISRENAQKLSEAYEARGKKYEEEAEKIAKDAEAHTQAAEKWETRANRFNLGEIFLQIAVVFCSIAILTQAQVFVFGGLGFATIGLGLAFAGMLIH
jgi:Flp pilus assembly protein TadB